MCQPPLLNPPQIVAGDLNCAHHPIDIHNPKTNLKSAGFTPVRSGCIWRVGLRLDVWVLGLGSIRQPWRSCVWWHARLLGSSSLPTQHCAAVLLLLTD